MKMSEVLFERIGDGEGPQVFTFLISISYQHFSSNVHSVNNMKFFAIEVVKGDVFTLEARERYWIDKLCTITRGLNSNRT